MSRKRCQGMAEPPAHWLREEKKERHRDGETKTWTDSNSKRPREGMAEPPPSWLRDETRDRQREVENSISEKRHLEVGLSNRNGAKTFTKPNSNCPENDARASLSNDHPSCENPEEEIDQLAGQNEERQARGPTYAHGGWGPNGGILEIETNGKGQPVGESGSKLATHMGVLARNGVLAPLTYHDWRVLPRCFHDRIWNIVKENTNATDELERWVLMSVGAKWRDWKSTIKRTAYYPYLTNKERLEHCPPRVEEDQWRILVYNWGTKESKEKTKRNASSRSCMTMPHTSGRTSHATIRNELKKADKKGASPTRRQVYKKTHKEILKNGKPNTQQVSEAIATMDDIAALYPEMEERCIVDEDVYSRVMGNERNGRVRTYGLGVNRSLLFGSSSKQSRRQVQLEVERVKAQFDEIEAKRKEEIEANEARRQAEMEANEARRQAEMEANEARRQAEMEANEARRQAEMEANETRRQELLEAQLSSFQARIEAAINLELDKRLHDSMQSTPLEQANSSGCGQVPDEATSPNFLSFPFKKSIGHGNLSLIPPNRRSLFLNASKNFVPKDNKKKKAWI